MKPRGTMPDAVGPDGFFIYKGCSTLRLTYQIKLLTYFAKKDHKRLILKVRNACVIRADLAEFMEKYNDIIQLERLNKMGLYLCVFKDDEELEGVEVGHYEYFGFFRDSIVTLVENGVCGSVCPTLILHPDCDGDWPLSDCKKLRQEFTIIADVFRQVPPQDELIEMRRDQFAESEIAPASLYDCFVDIDGENLIERIADLCSIAVKHNERILFQ